MGGYYYTTKQGDMWDQIAYEVYGDEYQVKLLYEANFELLDIYIFDDGYQIWCPEIEDVEDEDMEAESFPEWRDDEDFDDDIEDDEEESDEE